MTNRFLQIGKPIKMEIDITPPYFSLQGIIKKVEKNIFIVKIDIGYIQKRAQKVNCIIANDTETQVCLFKTTIKYAKNSLLTLAIPDEKDVQIVQRRKYVRVSVNKEVDCYLTGVNGKRVWGDKVFPATVKDIGGGGANLSSPLCLSIGTVLVFEIELDSTKLLLTAKVLRRTENDIDGTSDLGCEFIGISDADRQKIIAYCNRQQLILKKTKQKL